MHGNNAHQRISLATPSPLVSVDPCEFKTGLIYRMCSRTARAMPRNVSKKRKEKEKRKKEEIKEI